MIEDLVAWAPLLLRGAGVTLVLAVVSMATSLVWGLALALLRIAGPPPVRGIVVAYVECLRGLPLILTLFVIFFGLPTIGITISREPMIAGVLGITLSLGAYLSEVFRAAILSVPSGQREAALSIGMSRRMAYQKVILPQALVVAIPTLGGYFVGLLKDTALLSFISVTELMRTGVQIVGATFKAFEVYLYLAVIYVLMSVVASRIVGRLERRLRPLEDRYTGGSTERIARTAPPDGPLL